MISAGAIRMAEDERVHARAFLRNFIPYVVKYLPGRFGDIDHLTFETWKALGNSYRLRDAIESDRVGRLELNVALLGVAREEARRAIEDAEIERVAQLDARCDHPVCIEAGSIHPLGGPGIVTDLRQLEGTYLAPVLRRVRERQRRGEEINRSRAA